MVGRGDPVVGFGGAGIPTGQDENENNRKKQCTDVARKPLRYRIQKCTWLLRMRTSTSGFHIVTVSMGYETASHGTCSGMVVEDH